jgi:hypothetical protein
VNEGPPRPKPERYRTQSLDTDAETERYLFERVRDLPVWRKMEMLSAATRAACDLAVAGLRQRYPTASAEEIRKRLGALTLGRELSIELHGWDPEKEGW